MVDRGNRESKCNARAITSIGEYCERVGALRCQYIGWPIASIQCIYHWCSSYLTTSARRIHERVPVRKPLRILRDAHNGALLIRRPGNLTLDVHPPPIRADVKHKVSRVSGLAARLRTSRGSYSVFINPEVPNLIERLEKVDGRRRQ